MSEQTFWRCTPRKLLALAKVHAELRTPKEDKELPGRRKGKSKLPKNRAFIDQVI